MNERQGNDNRFTITVPEDWNGLSIEELMGNIWQLPRKMIHRLRMEKSTRLNEREAPLSKKIEAGNRLSLPILKEDTLQVVPASRYVNILYEDEHLLIANKPAGMKTHPNEKGDRETLTNALIHILEERGDDLFLQHVHRLDRDTTGAVLFAKHVISKAVLDRMLEERNITRIYTAIVHGKVKRKRGVIQGNIGRDRHHPTRRRVSPTGKMAITRYSVVRYDSKQNLTEVRCRLDTGRTHQIRVHFAHIGHPLVGDLLYGGKEMFYRQALHARWITFIHPFTLEKIEIEAPFLDGMNEIIL